MTIMDPQPRDPISLGVHWYDGTNCHPAVIAGDVVYDVGDPSTHVSSRIAQLDGVNVLLGITVTVLHEDATYDEDQEDPANNTWHLRTGCPWSANIS